MEIFYRFEAILAMVFSDVPEEVSTENSISSSLEATATTLGLVYNRLQAQKCMELYEQMQQRMGVVIVGPPGSGKSTIRQLLKTVRDFPFYAVIGVLIHIRSIR